MTGFPYANIEVTAGDQEKISQNGILDLLVICILDPDLPSVTGHSGIKIKYLAYTYLYLYLQSYSCSLQKFWIFFPTL